MPKIVHQDSAISRLEALRGQTKFAILIGPEGGFAPDERDEVRALEASVPISLGPRIMRAETAALAAITLFQATLGDWKDSAMDKRDLK